MAVSSYAGWDGFAGHPWVPALSWKKLLLRIRKQSTASGQPQASQTKDEQTPCAIWVTHERLVGRCRNVLWQCPRSPTGHLSRPKPGRTSMLGCMLAAVLCPNKKSGFLLLLQFPRHRPGSGDATSSAPEEAERLLYGKWFQPDTCCNSLLQLMRQKLNGLCIYDASASAVFM